MSNEIITVAWQIGIIFILGLVGALAFRRQFDARWFIGALALYIINDALLTRGFWTIPSFFPEADWNWQGKFMALMLTFAIASLPIFGWRRIGFTWHQGKKPWPAYALLIVLGIFFLGLAITGADGADDWETIVFQWTMPGFEEELFYRGTLLLAMNEAFRGKVNILGAPVGYGGVLMTILFGLGHALSFGDSGLMFSTGTFMVTGIPAFLLLWLREQTGSLLLPVIGHNIANGVGTLI